MTYRMTVSKVGKEARTAADKDLLFTSENNTLKVKDDSKHTLNNGATLQVSPGLSYLPLFFGYYNDGTGKWFHADNPGSTWGVAQNVGTSTDIDVFNGSGSSGTMRLFVFIDKME